MGKLTYIQWTHLPGYQGGTWNPWQGCTKKSPGCTNCYMYLAKKRYGQDPSRVVRSAKDTFELPLRTKERTAFFVCSWSDFLHETADPWREEAISIMNLCPQHIFLILTKRPERSHVFPWHWHDRWPGNVWVGATVENQDMAQERIPIISSYPAPVIFLSLEPMLESIRLADFQGFRYKRIKWVLCGFESGSGARIPSNAQELAVDIRDQCDAAGIPFFFKQWGGNRKIDGSWGGDKLEGKQYHEFPFWRKND